MAFARDHRVQRGFESAVNALNIGFENSFERVCLHVDGWRHAFYSGVSNDDIDTAALAQANVSIAPGSALDATRNAADIVMIGDTLADIPTVLRIARKAVALSKQNFGIAIVYNIIAVPVAMAGFATPLLAALAMSASSITVLINAMRVRL